jgi:hypothetical protein
MRRERNYVSFAISITNNWSLRRLALGIIGRPQLSMSVRDPPARSTTAARGDTSSAARMGMRAQANPCLVCSASTTIFTCISPRLFRKEIASASGNARSATLYQPQIHECVAGPPFEQRGILGRSSIAVILPTPRRERSGAPRVLEFPVRFRRARGTVERLSPSSPALMSRA